MGIYARMRLEQRFALAVLFVGLMLTVVVPLIENTRRLPVSEWREVLVFLLILVLPPFAGVAAANVSSKFMRWCTPPRARTKVLWALLAVAPAVSGVVCYLVFRQDAMFYPWFVWMLQLITLLWCCVFFCFWSALVIMVVRPQLGGFLFADENGEIPRLISGQLAAEQGRKAGRVLAVALVTFLLVTLLVLFGPEAETVSKLWISVFGENLHPVRGLEALRQFPDHFMQIALSFLGLFVFAGVHLVFSWKRIPMNHRLARREIRLKQRRDLNVCSNPECRYSRRGLMPNVICPECGAPAPTSAQ